MSKTYMTYELYDTIEINKEDYPELKDLTDEDTLKYLEENMWEFQLNESDEDDLASEFQYNRDLIKDKNLNEEYALHLIKED